MSTDPVNATERDFVIKVTDGDSSPSTAYYWMNAESHSSTMTTTGDLDSPFNISMKSYGVFAVTANKTLKGSTYDSLSVGLYSQETADHIGTVRYDFNMIDVDDGESYDADDIKIYDEDGNELGKGETPYDYSLSLDVGHDFTVSADVFKADEKVSDGNGLISWTSSDDSAVRVDQNGKLTAEGTNDSAVITAALKGTDISKTIDVTVNSNTAPTVKPQGGVVTVKSFDLSAEMYSDSTQYITSCDFYVKREGIDSEYKKVAGKESVYNEKPSWTLSEEITIERPLSDPLSMKVLVYADYNYKSWNTDSNKWNEDSEGNEIETSKFTVTYTWETPQNGRTDGRYYVVLESKTDGVKLTSNGSSKVSDENGDAYEPMDTVKVTAEEDYDHPFDHWDGYDADNDQLAFDDDENPETNFTMPNSDVNIKAVYKGEYEITEGADSQHVINDDGSVVIKCSGPLAEFDHLEIDDNTVSKDDYDAASGSTILTLHAGFLNTLSKGSHNVSFIYMISGKRYAVTTELSIVQQKTEKTGHAVSCEHDYQWEVETPPTEDKEGEALLKCTKCGDVKGRQPISAYQYYIMTSTDKLKKAKTGSTITISSDIWNSFPKSFMQELASRRDITVKIDFQQGHKKYEAVITPDVKVDTSSAYYGPDYMINVYKASEIKKTIK